MQPIRKSYRPPSHNESAAPVWQEAAVDSELPETSTPIREAFVCETHSAALLAATIASAVNAFKRDGMDKSEAALRPYVPREPALISVLRNGMLETDLDDDTVAVISDFFENLAPARIALDQYFADANHIGAERASVLHILPLSNSWRSACDDALVAVRQLHGFLERLPPQYTSNSEVLIELLQEAASGGSPCLNGEGQISLPDLPQRRHTARQTICQPCMITYNRTTFQGFVRDVSPGGFGLERVPQLVPKSMVMIELPSGRRFTGVVAWSSGSSAGVRFSRSLLPNDPLLSG